jgi:hypothetical protein
MNELNSHVIRFGRSLTGRLPDWQIDFALSYVTHGETALAIETLIDNICDACSVLSAKELEELFCLARSFPSIDMKNRSAFLLSRHQ